MRGSELALAALLLAGCPAEKLTVARLSGSTLNVELGPVDPQAATFQLTMPDGCPPLPSRFDATLNDTRPEQTAGGPSPTGCQVLQFAFPRSALRDTAPVDRFELSDPTGRVVVELVNLGRPHAFMSVNDQGAPFPDRPFFIQHRGGLTVANLGANWKGEARPAVTRVLGGSAQISPPADPANAKVLELGWDEPVSIQTCKGVARCTVDTRVAQTILTR